MDKLFHKVAGYKYRSFLFSLKLDSCILPSRSRIASVRGD